LGEYPADPDTVKATYSGSSLSIDITANGKSVSISVSVTKGSSEAAFITIGGSSIPIPSDVGKLGFGNDDFAAQQDSGSRGKGKFFTLFGASHSAGALQAWAWGVGRVIDAVEQLSSSLGINPKKLGVTGCSRNGKGALVAGAFNPRIALTIPQESGSGGVGCWRISDAMKNSGIDTQTASEIVGENVWFSQNFNSWTNKITSLPYDHHQLMGLISESSQALLVIENGGIDWLGPRSNYGCSVAARKIFAKAGAEDHMGISVAASHDHCSFPSSQQSELTAFINKFLKGGNDNTNVSKTDSTHGFNEADWIDW
jgi:hypothetical protein